MDLTKAQRLLIKIQAFLENGNLNELSRLEKDLMKSYVIQLYDAITSEEKEHLPDLPRFVEPPAPKKQFVEPPPVYIPEPPKVEPVRDFPTDPIVAKVSEVPLEITRPVGEHVVIPPKPVHFPIAEPVKETTPVYKPIPLPTNTAEGLEKLFDLSGNEDMSGRFSHVPIESIESGMGLNERIFTLNDLFGGNKGLFDATCTQLNALSSYSDAKTLLMNGPARQFKWSDPERIKMAEEFIRIVIRRYPKN